MEKDIPKSSLPNIDPNLHLISSEEELRNLSTSQYSQKFVFVGMIDSAHISKRGNLVVNLINPALTDAAYFTNKKNKAILAFLSSELQTTALAAIKEKFEWKLAGNTATYFKLGKLLPTLITCTVQASNSVYPPFLMCESITILTYKEYLNLAANCNISEIREIVTEAVQQLRKLHDDLKVPFSIIGKDSGDDNANLIKNFELSLLDTMREQYTSQQLLSETVAKNAELSEETASQESEILSEEELDIENLKLILVNRDSQPKVVALNPVIDQKVGFSKDVLQQEEQKGKKEEFYTKNEQQKEKKKEFITENEQQKENNDDIKTNTEPKNQGAAPIGNDELSRQVVCLPNSQSLIEEEGKNNTGEESEILAVAINDQKASQNVATSSVKYDADNADAQYFEMDIPQFNTQAQYEKSPSMINKSKPQLVHEKDGKLASQSNKSGNDVITGKRKEIRETLSSLEPALKKTKQTVSIDNEEAKNVATSESFDNQNQQKHQENGNESSLSVFSNHVDNDFYSENNMVDDHENNDEEANINEQSKVNTGKNVLDLFFENVPVNPSENNIKGNTEISTNSKIREEELKISEPKDNLPSSEPENIQNDSVVEDNENSQPETFKSTEITPPLNNAVEQQEIIFSQPTTQTPPVTMISKGTQTPMNFFAFNILYNQAVFQAAGGQITSFGNRTSLTSAELPSNTTSKTIDKPNLKAPIKRGRKPKNTEQKDKQNKETVDGKDVKNKSKNLKQPPFEVSNEATETSSSKTKSVTSELEANNSHKQPEALNTATIPDKSDMKQNKAIKEKKTSAVKEVKQKSSATVAKSKSALKNVDVATSLPSQPTGEVAAAATNVELAVTKTVSPAKKKVERSKGTKKAPVIPYVLKLNGYASKINRLIKNAKDVEKIKCVVVGIVPFESNLDLNRYANLTLNVVELSDYNLGLKANNFDGVVIDLNVKNTVLLAQLFKAKTGEHLYDNMVKMFFCNTEKKEIEFTIKKESDGSFTWVHKQFKNENIDAEILDSNYQKMHPVKKGDIPLSSTKQFSDLDISSIGTFSTNVLLVGIRCKKGLASSKYRLLVTDFTECQYLRDVNLRDVTSLGGQALHHVYEVFVGNDIIAESLISELQNTYGKELNDFNFQFAADTMYFNDLMLSQIGVILSLKYSTKFYSNMLDIRYLTSTLLKYQSGFEGPLESMEQLKKLYENYDATVPKSLLNVWGRYIETCIPYSHNGKEYVLFAEKYNKEKEEAIKRQVELTLNNIQKADKLSTYEKVLETSSLKDLLENKENTNIIFQLSNYQLLKAKYMSNGCVEFKVGVKNETGFIKMYILPETYIYKMFPQRENPKPNYPVIYSEVSKLKFPTSPKNPIFLCSYKMDFRNDGCTAYYWVVTGFSTMW